MHAQLVARDLTFAHGPTTVLDGVSITVAAGHRVGIVGPNGVGKSTLLRILCGDLEPDSGSISRLPADAAVGHLTQELDVRAGERVEDVVRRRLGITAADARLEAATAAVAAGSDGAADDYDRALARWLRLGGADLDHRLDDVLDRVGLDTRHRGQGAQELSGGERARVNLACVLLSGFDILALDEPTNDLDLGGLELLEELLVASSSGYVLVSHDRAFLERVVTSVVEIDEHARTSTRFDGGWTAYEEARAVARRHAEEAFATYVDRRDDLRARAQRQREWADQGRRKAVTRSTDNDKFIRSFKIDQTERLAAKAKATQRAMERLEVVEKPWEGWELRLSFPEGERSGREVAVLRDTVVRHDGFTFGPMSLDIREGERVAVLGPNGAGKSTLLDLVLGRIEPAEGTVRVGPSVVSGALDQRRTRFETGDALLDAFVAETGVTSTEARSQLAKLGLGPEHVARPTTALSPGERTRAVLAAFAIRGVNLLVLDEPTNHLDLPAIEQLEAALADYQGTLLLVTHDRRMLEHVTTDRTIRLEDGRLTEA